MVKSKDGTKFPRRPKGKLSCDKLKDLTQKVANYNFLNSLTPRQVRLANSWESKLRKSCYKPFKSSDYHGP